jgi:hypothetical protein
MDVAELDRVYETFCDFHAYFAPAFCRKQWREHSRYYLQALLVQSQERRNAENLSELVPVSARALQRFLTEARWDNAAVVARLQEYLGPRLAHPLAVWVLDGSDFPKQGVKSVGVARQYCGVLGKVASCQAGVFLAHVGPRAGPWWTSVCIYRRDGPGTRPGAPRRGCPRPNGGTGRKPTWPWRCCRKPETGGTSRLSGSPETTPSGCPQSSGMACRPRGCSTSWRSPRIRRSGRWNRPGAARLTRDAGGLVDPSRYARSVRRWRSGVGGCRRSRDVR